MNEYHDEFTDLLGAFALDAVDRDEMEAIELHLMECPRCRAEVSDHREVAVLLSHSGEAAPEGVWGRIEAELAPPAPPMRLELGADPAGATDTVSAPVVSLDQHRAARGFGGRTMAAVVAAAACIVAVLGIVAVGQSNRLDRLESVMGDPTIEGLANDAVAGSQVSVELTGDVGSAQAVVDGAGQGYLIMDDLPPPAEGDLYQLWGKVDGVVLSLGTFGSEAAVVPFSVDPGRVEDIELFAVTEEKAPGVIESANPAVIAGEV
jgi:hypothetical protein